MAEFFVAPDELSEQAPLEQGEDEQDEVFALASMAIGEIRALTDRLALGRIPTQVWADDMVDILVAYHLAAWIAGSGNSEPTDDDLERLADFIADEINFLAGFQAALEAEPEGIEIPQKYRTRGDLYGRATQVSYWSGIAFGFGINLPFFPADRTLCGRNCNCRWVIETVNQATGDYDATWLLGISDHCPTCVARSALRPFQIRDGLWVPGQLTADMIA